MVIRYSLSLCILLFSSSLVGMDIIQQATSGIDNKLSSLPLPSEHSESTLQKTANQLIQQQAEEIDNLKSDFGQKIKDVTAKSAHETESFITIKRELDEFLAQEKETVAKQREYISLLEQMINKDSTTAEHHALAIRDLNELIRQQKMLILNRDKKIDEQEISADEQNRNIQEKDAALKAAQALLNTRLHILASYLQKMNTGLRNTLTSIITVISHHKMSYFLALITGGLLFAGLIYYDKKAPSTNL